MSDVVVRLDNRARLVGAVLAAGQWPDREQATLPHAVHAHARLTRAYVRDYAAQPAVAFADRWLADGQPLTDLFSAALRAEWPGLAATSPLPAGLEDGRWLALLGDFYVETGLAAFFWAEHTAVWETAVAELRALFAGSPLFANSERLSRFLSGLRAGPPAGEIQLTPNLLYPALRAVVATAADRTILLLPPPKAVGESPPWPYREGRGWVMAETGRHLLAHWLAPALEGLDADAQAHLVHAATTLFLAAALDEGEAMAYQVQKRRQASLPRLPVVVDRLRAHMAADGRADDHSLAELAQP